MKALRPCSAPMYADSWPKMPRRTCTTIAPSTIAASFTPPGTLAKNETTSRASPSSGMIIIPLMPWMMKPPTPVKLEVLGLEGGLVEHASLVDPDAESGNGEDHRHGLDDDLDGDDDRQDPVCAPHGFPPCSKRWQQDGASAALCRAFSSAGLVRPTCYQDCRPTTSSSTGPSWLTTTGLRLRRGQDLLQPTAEVGRRGLVVEVQDDLDVVGVVGPAQDPVGPHAVLLAEALVLVEGGLPAVVVVDRGADLD